MGIWDIFKKKKEEPPQLQKLSQEELQEWLKTKQEEISKQEQQLFNEVKEKINKLAQELTEEISALNQVDFEKKKEREKIKAIVQENFRNYIIKLERLINKIQEIENSSNVINQINKIFYDFEKRSKPNYEKATYLIGKEMADTKESIKSFFRDIERIVKNNQKQIEESQIVKEIKEEVEKYKQIQETNSKIIEEIEEQVQKINKIKGILQKYKEDKEEIKNSQVYHEKERKIKQLEIKKQELETNKTKLKQLISFKSLTNIYHKNQKEMGILKEYRENFKQTFNKTRGEDLFNLLKDSSLYTEEMSNLIQKINNIKQELSNTKIEHTELNSLDNSIKNLEYEIEQITLNKENREKTQTKFKENKEDILESLKKKLRSLNIEFN